MARIVIVVILIGLCGLAWDSNNRLTVQETRTQMIVAALPDLRTRVAYETVNTPFRSAVIVSKPKQSGEQWAANIQIVDPKEGLVFTYRAKLEGKDARRLNREVIGSVMEADRAAVNFREIQSMAKEVRQPVFTPETVDDTSSFVVYADPENLKGALDALGLSVVGVSPLPDVKTWTGLVEAMGAGKLADRPE